MQYLLTDREFSGFMILFQVCSQLVANLDDEHKIAGDIIRLDHDGPTIKAMRDGVAIVRETME